MEKEEVEVESLGDKRHYKKLPTGVHFATRNIKEPGFEARQFGRLMLLIQNNK